MKKVIFGLIIFGTLIVGTISVIKRIDSLSLVIPDIGKVVSPISLSSENIVPAVVSQIPFLTPGATNPDITQDNISQNICNPKWSTKSIRPPVSYTNPLKIKQIAEYGYNDTNKADYEEDHLISLEIGGSPTDPKNLWPEPYAQPGAKQKDVVENYLHKEVCNGDITLVQAQTIIVQSWYAEYLKITSSQKLGAQIDNNDPDDN